MKPLPVGLEFALDHGWPVFPVRERDVGKRKAKSPLTNNGVHDATVDVVQIREWSREHSECAWGAAMGRGTLAVDIDVKSGAPGEASLARIVSEHAPLPDTLTNRTWSGGRQLLLAHDPALSFKNTAGEFAPGIDIRSDGGFIVIPRSRVYGREYQWERVDSGIAPAPTWLLDLLPKKFDKATKASAGDVPEGKRNSTAYRTAFFLRARNVPESDAWSALVHWNDVNCAPPLDLDELRRCFENAWKHEPGFALTDLGNADRVVAQHGQDLRHLKGAGWHLWNEHRWTPDVTGRVMQVVANVVRGIYSEATAEPDTAKRKAIAAWANRSEGRSRLEAAAALTEWQQEVADQIEHYDADPLLIGLQNGVYDLRADQFRAGQRDDRITLAANVEFKAGALAPRWEKFQEEIHPGDAELVAFKRRALGYTLCGDDPEQKLFIPYGGGANGKTTEQMVMMQLLGAYARKVEPETLLTRDRRGANNDIARLRGARFIGTAEVEDGAKLAESLVKMLTGGDMISARFLYREYFQFRMSGKIWLATNHRPEVTGTEYAIWRRILLIPYERTFKPEERDPQLGAALIAEASGIFNWLLAGYREWRARGLAPPPKVLAATEQYREDMDRVGQFLKECTRTPGKGGRAPKASDVYRRYKAWMKENGMRFVSARKFHERLERDHGMWRVKHDVEVYPGLEILPWGEAEDAHEM